jgi:hypothetical protein
VKIPAIIVVASALVALAAPSSYAAGSRTAPEFGFSGASLSPVGVSQDAQIKALQAKLKVLKAKNKAAAGKNKALVRQIKALQLRIQALQPGRVIPVLPLVPAVSVPLPTPDRAEVCRSTGNECTPAEACEWWGYDCSLAEALARQAAAAATPAPEDSANLSDAVESSASDSSNSEAAPVEDAATESTASTANVTSVGNMIEENWEC